MKKRLCGMSTQERSGDSRRWAKQFDKIWLIRHSRDSLLHLGHEAREKVCTDNRATHLSAHGDGSPLF